jgi:hypothetical protein
VRFDVRTMGKSKIFSNFDELSAHFRRLEV